MSILIVIFVFVDEQEIEIDPIRDQRSWYSAKTTGQLLVKTVSMKTIGTLSWVMCSRPSYVVTAVCKIIRSRKSSHEIFLQQWLLSSHISNSYK